VAEAVEGRKEERRMVRAAAEVREETMLIETIK
jgi:hypothetical protein